MKKLIKEEKYLGVHFTDVSVCMGYLEQYNLSVSDNCVSFIKKMHDAVFFVNQNMPMNILSEICSRCANDILKRIELDLKVEKGIIVKFKRYCKSDYLLS